MNGVIGYFLAEPSLPPVEKEALVRLTNRQNGIQYYDENESRFILFSVFAHMIFSFISAVIYAFSAFFIYQALNPKILLKRFVDTQIITFISIIFLGRCVLAMYAEWDWRFDYVGKVTKDVLIFKKVVNWGSKLLLLLLKGAD